MRRSATFRPSKQIPPRSIHVRDLRDGVPFVLAYQMLSFASILQCRPFRFSLSIPRPPWL